MAFTLLSDNFTGTTGASITGHTPNTPYGSIVWADLVASFSIPAPVFRAGGGFTTAAGSGGDGAGTYNLTGAPANQTLTYTFWSDQSAQGITFQFRRSGSGGTLCYLTLGISTAGFMTVNKVVNGGSEVTIHSGSPTVSTSTVHTVIVNIATVSGTTTIGVKLDGVDVSGFTALTCSDPELQTSGNILMYMSGGAETTGYFGSILVTTPSATTATVTGPTSLAVGSASSNYTVTLDKPAPDGGVSFAEAATGFTSTFTPTPKVIAAGALTGTFTATPSTAGTGTIGGVATPSLTVTAQSGVTASISGPTTATISGPSTCTTGSPSTAFTVTLGSAAPSGGTAVVLSDASAGGTFAGTGVSGSTLTIASGQTVGTFTYSRPTAGTSVITPTSGGITFTPTTLSITASSTPATAFTLTGPSSGSVSVESSNFSVTPNGIETGTFTPTAVSGVTFTPATLVWTGDGSTKTFTINKSSPGTVSVNGTFSNSLTPPSSVSYTFVAVSTDVTYLSSLYGVPAGVTPTAVIKNPAGGTVTPTSGGSVVAQGTGAFSVSFTAPSGLYLVAWTASGTVVLDNAVAVGGGGGGATAGEVVSTLLTTTADGAIGSVGEALKAARSAAFGKLVRSGTTLKHYATDDTTVIKTFTLDDPLTPTSRV